jgi:dimethylaniline monooxygenase (N-oxide forming)
VLTKLSERNYHHFWTEVPVGMAQVSDCPMSTVPRSHRYYDLFPAQYVTQYLEDYVDNHVSDSQTLKACIRTNTRVCQVLKVNGK